MKKIKLSKKLYKRKSKNKNENFKIKSFLKYLILLIFIILLFYITRIIIKDKIVQIFEENYDPEIINYKGEKVQRKKLIEDYLSIAPENDENKLKEKDRLYKNFYLDEYPNNKKKRFEIKLKFISQMKNNNTKKIDIFYMKNNYRLGNSIISLNNAIFYCEIVGCKKILLRDHKIDRKWLLTNTIYIIRYNNNVRKC